MSEKKYKIHDPYAAIKDFVAGSFGGVGLVAAGHPFDTVKVKLQTSTKGISLMDCVKTTLKEKGPFGFYAGALSPLIGMSAMNSLLFFGYNQTARILRKDGDVSKLTMNQIAICGGAGGGICSIVEAPQDLIKVKLQSGQTNATGTISCFKDIFKNYGVRGLFQGYTSTLVRNVPANVCYFYGYEYFKRVFSPGGDSSKASKMGILAAGGFGGMAYWAFIYPLDMLKSVVQGEPSDPLKRKYRNYLGACRGVVSEFGVRGLFRGFIPCMLRSFPANAACFFLYEMAKKVIKDVGVKKVLDEDV